MRNAALIALLVLAAGCNDARINTGNADPEAAILEPAPEAEYLVGETVTFRGAAADGNTAPSELEVSWSSSVDSLLLEEAPDDDGETLFDTDQLSAGEHTITLRVVDPDGASDTDAITITVLEPETENTAPTCSITAPADDAELEEGATVVFEGTASDAESASTALSARWTSSEDGELGLVTPSSSGGIALPISTLTPGTHVITLDVTDPEDLNCSEFIVVTVAPDNYPPFIGAPSVAPNPLYTTSTATCFAPTPTDVEGDAVDVQLRWGVDGLDPGVAGSTLASGFFVKGQSVRCSATPSDATGTGAPATSPSVTVSDTPPTPPGVSVSPAAPVEAIDDLVCSVVAPSTDADGETVTYSVSWTYSSAPYSGVTSQTVLPGDTIPGSSSAAGTWVCSVTPTAASVAGPPGTAQVAVASPNSPPSIGNPTVSPNPLYTGDTATCTAPTPTDPEGDAVTVATSWLVNGSPAGGTTTTLASSYFVKGQTVQCVVTPSDATGTGASATSPSVTVSDTPPTQPGVSIAPSSPVAGVDSLVCSVLSPSTDADGETVTYSVSWTYASAPWTGSTGTTTETGDTIPSGVTAAGTWGCSVTPTAASVNGSAGTAQVTVSPPVPVGKLVFITSSLQNGALGGISGADQVCQQRANAAGLSGTFKAWLSGSSYASSPASRFTRSTSQPYVRTDGAVVANDWADLTDGTIQNPINVDENGVSRTSPTLVWSYTRIDGSQGLFGNQTANCYGGDCHCNNWTSTATQGNPTPGSAFSLANNIDDDWTDYSFANACGGDYRLKCFQQ